jgi:hypothetical protein
VGDQQYCRSNDTRAYAKTSIERRSSREGRKTEWPSESGNIRPNGDKTTRIKSTRNGHRQQRQVNPYSDTQIIAFYARVGLGFLSYCPLLARGSVPNHANNAFSPRRMSSNIDDTSPPIQKLNPNQRKRKEYNTGHED